MSTKVFKDTKTAIIIATNKRVEVYRNHNDQNKWIDRSDCTTQYETKELKFTEEYHD